MIVLYILLFIVFLSMLIMIHELGHLLTAKMFKVYCFEYAIGFGPKIFSFKRKGGETAFSLRAIPFGGFVSMYGESDTVPEGFTEQIDESRSLLHIKKWKRAIILVAGVTMNALLAIVMFFIYEVGFPKYYGHYAHITVKKDSIAYNAGLKSGDYVYSQIFTKDDGTTFIFYDDSISITYTDYGEVKGFIGFNYANISVKNASLYSNAVMYEAVDRGDLSSISSYTSLTVSQINNGEASSDTNYKVTGYLVGLGKTKDKKVYAVINQDFGDNSNQLYVRLDNYIEEDYKFLPINSEVTFGGNVISESEGKYTLVVSEKHYHFLTPNLVNNLLTSNYYPQGSSISYEPSNVNFSFYKVNEEAYSSRGEKVPVNASISKSGSRYYLPKDIGTSMQIESKMSSFGESIKNTFVDFGDAATIIGRSLASLLTDANSWKNVGGIISIGVITTRALEEYGFGVFLRYWALISVNLAIVNLLPFPGLDGWQLLVVAVEGIFRKEIPAKVKNYISAIGIILLFALMALIIIKDIVGLV